MEPRLCDYSGLFFCSACHWNDSMVVPARVVHNWDFDPRPVSRSSKQLLELLQRKPLLNISKLNSALFDYVAELRMIRKMRSDILLMKCYFVCCRAAREQRILWHLKRHQHFVEGAEMYSLLDLVELQDGRLETHLAGILEIFTQHIKQQCPGCMGNGFFCELCSDKDTIFPFDDYTTICKGCFTVFHRRCFDKADKSETSEKKCPRCERREIRRASAALLPDVTPPETSPVRTTAADWSVASRDQSSERTASADWSVASRDKSSERTAAADWSVASRDQSSERTAAADWSTRSRDMPTNPFEDAAAAKNPFDDEERAGNGYDHRLNPFE